MSNYAGIKAFDVTITPEGCVHVKGHMWDWIPRFSNLPTKENPIVFIEKENKFIKFKYQNGWCWDLNLENGAFYCRESEAR